MRSTSWFGQGLAAVLLLAAGAILWRAGELEQRIAAAERDLVTLRYDSAAATAAGAPSRLAALLPGESRTVADAASLQATAAYWEGDYNTVATNPQAKLLAANAAYRTARRQGGTWQAVVGRLDQVVKSYAEILREDPDNTEAAFNYEYATRLRAVIAARKQPVAALDVADKNLTIHGFAGAPPEASDMKKFKMIVPMRPDERLEAEKAGKGTTKVRKG
jgi:tetratricopeptide (TPR) repeat protein